MIREHDGEPTPGLPEPLPLGERVLWQGAPSTWRLAKSAFHVRAVAAYFVLLAAWRGVSQYHDGADAATALAATALPIGLALIALALLLMLAWLMARSTLYTITSARLVMRFGVAFPMTVNVPFKVIASAAVKRRADGSGDITLCAERAQRVSYLLMWPHIRPWRFLYPEPMLRAIADVESVSATLAGALESSLASNERAERHVPSEGCVVHSPAPLAEAS